MRKRRYLEAFIGLIILAIVIAFSCYIAQIFSSKRSISTYNITAIFSNINGIQPGADVKISGLKVGQVASIKLDKSYKAQLNLIIHSDVQIPIDSSASVATNGLLGDKFINLSPGAEEEYIPVNGKISYTQSSVDLEGLLNKFVVGGSDKSQTKPQ